MVKEDILDISSDIDQDYVDSPSDIPTSHSDDNMSKTALMIVEAYRLETFSNWPTQLPVRPEDLARDGFYAIRRGDCVKCIFCGIVLKSWEQGDSVRSEHCKFSPRCPFLNNENVENIPLNSNSEPFSAYSTQLSQSTPHHPEYAEETARQISYSNWSPKSPQGSQALAAAGFFYTGHGDNVKCFFCGVSLRNWERADVPLDEHIRWSGDCFFVKDKKKSQRTARIVEVAENSGVIRRVLDMGYTQELIMGFLEENLESPHKYRDLTMLTNELDRFHIEPVSRQVGNIRITSPPIIATQHGGRTGASNIHVNLGQSSRSPPLPSRQANRNQETSSSRQSENIAVSMRSGTTENVASSMTGNEEAEEKLMCKVCMERDVEVTFMPCGHLVCCSICAQKIIQCPICRKPIRGSVRTYLS